MSNAWKAVSAGALGLALVLALVLAVSLIQSDGGADPDPLAAYSYGCSVYTEQGCAKFVAESGGEIEVQSGATLDVQSGATFNIGSIYPLLNATAGKEVVCGTTGTFTATAALDLSGSLTTVDAIVVTQITDAASTGAFVTATDPTTTTVTVKSWETDATAGTTGIDAHYCAIGSQ